ncbi:MAG TPA: CbiX/SirB N-terminal domain-containing protein [Thermoanaerobaculia bacterium]|nr:CbiX/SirB N-terminal domain-containing protein [Thermoanaerobaculia bacterium]
MQGVILFSHGSVLCGAERNLLGLAGRMRERGEMPIVEVAFLNYTEPDFETAVGRCVEQGATKIVIAPYFLIAGKFVLADLPATINSVRPRYPHVTFSTVGVIGFHRALADAVIASASVARPPAAWEDAAVDNSAWCREQPKCPLFGSTLCRVRTEVPA